MNSTITSELATQPMSAEVRHVRHVLRLSAKYMHYVINIY